ncbi:MAG: DNA mismatch repair endonuclease MutL [Oscillospiraceae bacterium]|nr:DNA mismatch repair endonuclease MutL [Oscillospiraceae bacterium]
MPIRVLDKNVCEQIAAGEVVERPASVIKELVENAVDAGATCVEVELRRSGLELMRVSDNGCGIAREEVPTAFLRHATSKIRTESDLESIATLGFRGEALAAICAVARVKLVTKRPVDALGTAYCIEGGAQTDYDETGAPDGTSVYVRDLFFNTPARMKFLKKDVHEGNAVQSVVEQQALAHPEVAFKLTRDGKLAFTSPGTGDLRAAVYSVFPRDAADNLVELAYETNGVAVAGYVTAPGFARASRGYQFVFINGRFVKSRGVCAAAEEACRGLVMAGKYPCFALALRVPFEDVDINVHPAKTEVRFKNERAVTSAVYAAVRAAVADAAVHAVERQSDLAPAAKPIYAVLSEKPDDSTASADAVTDNGKTGRKNESFLDFWPETDGSAPARTPLKETLAQPGTQRNPEGGEDAAPWFIASDAAAAGAGAGRGTAEEQAGSNDRAAAQMRQTRLGAQALPGEEDIRVLGELFDTYIVAQRGDTALFIDKHAAHERLLYEEIKTSDIEKMRQLLLEPIVLTLPAEEKTALLENAPLLEGLGFVIGDFGGREVCVREIPTYFSIETVSAAVEKIAARLCGFSNDLTTDEREWLVHSTACRAAIKAGGRTPTYELQRLCEDILSRDVPKFCPHGRPVFFTMDKKEFEKRFGRI